MKIALRFRILGLFSLMLVLLGGCWGSSDEKVLVMGTSSDYPPFEFIEHGKVIGMDIDIAEELVKELGYELKVEDMDYGTLIAALKAGRVDFVISGMSPTEERKKNVDFTEEYYKSEFGVLYKKGNAIRSIEEMSGKIIGAQLGSTMESYLKEAHVPGLRINTLSKNPDLLQELKLGRIDGLMLDRTVVEKYAAIHKDLEYSLLSDSGGGSAVALPKGSELTEDFNEAIRKLKANGKLKAIKQKWLKMEN